MTWLPWVPGEATKTFHKVNGCLIGILYSGFLHNPYITWVMLSSPKLYYSKQQSKNFMAQVESKLWMMTGEDEPFGSRKIRYDDEAYCMEAHGLLDHQKDWMF